MPKKKSAAQLNREIAESLRKKSAAATKSKNNGNGKKKQEAILMVANDAALSEQVSRVESILAEGAQRAIATAYKTTTPESAEAGDYEDQGWDDEEGDPIEVDVYDIEEALGNGSAAPVTDAFVKKAIRWLRDHGASEASSSHYHSGVWYSSPSEVSDYSTGEERSEDFFLRNFTAKEEQLIFDGTAQGGFKRGGR